MKRILLAAALCLGLAAASSASAQTIYGYPTVPTPRNFKAGFTLSVDATTPTAVVDVGAGQAADSTNTVLLSNTVAGTVNLGASGAGGLDTGSVGASAWYALFEIYGSSGYSAIASAPSVISTTGAITSSSTTLGTASGTNITSGSNITVPGAGPGATNLNTTVSGAPTAVSVAPTGTTTNSSNSITSVSSLTSVIPGLAITDSKACIPAGTVITAASGSTITLSQNTNSSGCGSGDTLTITGDNVTLANAASTTVGETGGTTTNLTVPVWGVSSISGRTPMSPLLPSGYSYYRYIGSVKTNGSSQIVPFTQSGDKFWLETSVQDANGVALGAVSTMVPLTVPLGVKVQPIIRAGASAYSLLTSPDEPDAGVNGGATPAPGYDLATSSQAFPSLDGSSSLLETNVAAQLRARTISSASLYIITRGWIESWGRAS